MREQISRLLVDESSWFMGVGAVLLAIAPFVEKSHHRWFVVLLAIGATLAAAGIMLKLPVYISKLPKLAQTYYQVLPAQKSDLKGLHKFCCDAVGHHFATIEQWHQRYDKNSETLFMVMRKKVKKFESKEKLVGCFSIIPVSEEAKNLLEQNKLNATLFTSNHLMPPSAVPAALYVSGIVASGFRAKGMTLSFLADRLIAARQRNDVPIYTRPMTSDGLRLTEGYKFVPVNTTIPAALEHIWVHHAAAESVLPVQPKRRATGNRIRKLQRGLTPVY